MSNAKKDIMDDKQDKHLVEFFNLLRLGIKKHGMRKLTKKFKELSVNDEDQNDYKMFDVIVQYTCEEFGMTRTELLGKQTRGNSQVARLISVQLMLEYTKIKVALLATFYDRTRQIIHKWLNDAQAYSVHNKFDEKNYYQPKQKIKNKIDETLNNI